MQRPPFPTFWQYVHGPGRFSSTPLRIPIPWRRRREPLPCGSMRTRPTDQCTELCPFTLTPLSPGDSTLSLLNMDMRWQNGSMNTRCRSTRKLVAPLQSLPGHPMVYGHYVARCTSRLLSWNRIRLPGLCRLELPASDSDLAASDLRPACCALSKSIPCLSSPIDLSDWAGKGYARAATPGLLIPCTCGHPMKRSLLPMYSLHLSFGTQHRTILHRTPHPTFY